MALPDRDTHRPRPGMDRRSKRADEVAPADTFAYPFPMEPSPTAHAQSASGTTPVPSSREHVWTPDPEEGIKPATVTAFGSRRTVEAPQTSSANDVTSPSIPWLGWRSAVALVDLVGLAAALVLLAVQTDLSTAAPRLTVMLMGTVSIALWLLVGQRRTLGTVLRRPQVVGYGVPLAAALLGTGLAAIAHVPLPFAHVATFVLVWTMGLVLGRVIVWSGLPPLRVLLVGDPAFASELRELPGIDVACRVDPPTRFRGWDVVVTDPAVSYEPEWVQWMDHADLVGVKVLSAPLVLEALTKRVPFEMLNGRWAFQVLEGQSKYLVWKRAFDVAAVVVFAPFILLLAAVVALVVIVDSGRPILFRQERVGLKGKPFNMLKFRSMHTDAEFEGHAFATQYDPRITKVGHFLRKFRLDEIPQFWNVLVGDMSIIGPRPEQRGFAGQFADEIPLYELRHNLRPGITGWAQVMHGYADDALATRIKLRHDFYYVRSCSFWLDARIVFETLRTIATGFGSR